MELGSEFSLSLSKLSVVEHNLVSYIDQKGLESTFFDSGRSAIKYLRQIARIDGEVLLPEYICESVIRCFLPNQIQFYKINNSFTADIEDIKKRITTKTKAIVVMHYFGSLQPCDILKQIREISDRKGIVIIEDVTHSLFTSIQTIGDYVVASVRKWMQIPGGGVLLSKEKINTTGVKKQTDNTKAYGMILKDLFLQGSLECNAVYRYIFEESEEKLNNQEDIYSISDLSTFVMKCIDVPLLVRRRKQNYTYLRDLLDKRGIKPAVEIKEDCCPLVLPLRVPERDKFRKYLNDNQIYCAVHWPMDGIRVEEREQAIKNSKELISLPIDQRYDEEHLNYLDSVIKRYRGELKL